VGLIIQGFSAFYCFAGFVVHVQPIFTAIEHLFLYVYDLSAAKLTGRFDICKCFNKFFYAKIYVLQQVFYNK